MGRGQKRGSGVSRPPWKERLQVCSSGAIGAHRARRRAHDLHAQPRLLAPIHTCSHTYWQPCAAATLTGRHTRSAMLSGSHVDAQPRILAAMHTRSHAYNTCCHARTLTAARSYNCRRSCAHAHSLLHMHLQSPVLPGLTLKRYATNTEDGAVYCEVWRCRGWPS